jgi:hypothetical protein
MPDRRNIWVTEHAYERFMERIVHPNDLGFDERFCSKRRVLEFIKRLGDEALAQDTGGTRISLTRHHIDWPYDGDGIKNLVLVVQADQGVVVTCWIQRNELEPEENEFGGAS